ncbi:ATP phosphoribosyltransferase [Fructobacillus ficulneus]|uniref:ATP phosphoribosyltransferase n=1 Tax=Fructobacillus ficulneus TaxID=157463 RepID=A0A0K8MGP2_9LACO|nr:ATP phosphoribosyltransferase [Fructobacillus ficulneus]GAO99632.1 ATP phosphoribosyltransferase regulatory subunit/ ATP phosphoribosyltransferase catalytic subunit [Fructobacillus ficulneus]
MDERGLAAGSKDLYGQELKDKQKIREVFSQRLNDLDFTPVRTALVERATTYGTATSSVFRLLGQSEENLVLRPDLTMPIARLVAATNHPDQFSQLYYFGDVFHPIDHLSGDYNQETQAGIELLGQADFAAEIRGLDIMLDFARTFGIIDVQVVLSDARLIDLILAPYNLGSDRQRELKASIEEKNLTVFRQITDKISNFPGELANWPLAFGESGETVMDELRNIEAVQEILANWQLLATHLHNYYPEVSLTVDLAGSSPQPYYTGTIIRGFVPSLGRYLFTGGRYDGLMKNKDQQGLPAFGLALKIETILADWQRQPQEVQPNQPIVMVLAKGRVEEDVRLFLRAAGVDNEELDRPGRKLIFNSPDGRYRFILVKPTDVVKYLDLGIGDIGIVGSDTVAEQESDHYDVLDLQTGKAAFILAAPAGFNLTGGRRKRIATKYPKVARAYFQAHGEDVELIKLEGSVELGPLTGLSDAIIDITQTGKTLEENNLVIYDQVGQVSTHLLVRRGALLQHQAELSRLIQTLSQELAGEANANY